MNDIQLAPVSDLPCRLGAERNKQPILEAMREVLGESGLALETALDTGQHVVWFAAALKNWLWQATEADRNERQMKIANLAENKWLNVKAADMSFGLLA